MEDIREVALYILSTGFGAARDVEKLPLWRSALCGMAVIFVEVGEVWVEGCEEACCAALSAAIEHAHSEHGRSFRRQVLVAQSRGAWHAVAALERGCWVDDVVLLSSTADPRDVHRASAAAGNAICWLHGSADGGSGGGDGPAGLAASYIADEVRALAAPRMLVDIVEGDGHLLESLADGATLRTTMLRALELCAATAERGESSAGEDDGDGGESIVSLRDLSAEKKVLMLFVRFDEDCDSRLSYAEFDAFQRATEEGAGLPLEVWHGICGMIGCSPHDGMSLGDLLAIYTAEELVARLQTDVHADHLAIFGDAGA